MNWQRITPDTPFDYSDTYLFRVEKTMSEYFVGSLHHIAEDGTPWLMLGDSEWFGDNLVKPNTFSHYCIITEPNP